MVWCILIKKTRRTDRRTDRQWQIQIKGLWRFSRLFALEPILYYLDLDPPVPIFFKKSITHLPLVTLV